ncbi:DUF2147 domain-containing protein [Moraxella pluranimalium]|uniref:DUF2147 domain-containing protein n=1 Tax=Moraxella pluranimalium TaxID=470453 RepID=A0A1T0CKR4_9GAMM|nr:hypothetical protein [Moraxella pluranimalium]OOS22940.1 hypothetical protein B0680_08995 [Moraxella pluranimalium]
MKFATKLMAIGAGVLLSASAMAADPIVGKWKMTEKGEAKAIITISQSGDKFVGVMTKGLTEKAKKTEGRTILTDIQSQGGGKYKGKGEHPTLRIKGTVNITVSGNNLTIKSITGTQTGVRQ